MAWNYSCKGVHFLLVTLIKGENSSNLKNHMGAKSSLFLSHLAEVFAAKGSHIAFDNWHTVFIWEDNSLIREKNIYTLLWDTGDTPELGLHMILSLSHQSTGSCLNWQFWNTVTSVSNLLNCPLRSIRSIRPTEIRSPNQADVFQGDPSIIQDERHRIFLNHTL